jgi:prepilin-type N-terminal cleavage/methylation domain-containing protein
MSKRRAFTSTELLVVIVVLALLASLALPVTLRALGRAREVRVTADLATVAMGLHAYKQDFGDYPRPDGAQALCRALLAPGPDSVDGADGPGFRLRRAYQPDRGVGLVWGPYVLQGFHEEGGALVGEETGVIQYRLTGPGAFALVAAGEDGTFGTPDDVEVRQ